MAQELELSETEKAQVETLLEKQSLEMSTLKASLSPQDADFTTKLKELHKTHEEQLKKTIGNEKYAKWKENRMKEKEKIEAAKNRM